MNAALAPQAPTGQMAVLKALLVGQATAADAVANTLRVEAFGHTTFGRTDALDLFATHPLVLSALPHVLLTAQALAVLDETDDGRCIGVFADLADGVLTRLWVVASTAADAQPEAAVPVARDDFLSQLRVPCVGDAADHPGLAAEFWPDLLLLGSAALTVAAVAAVAPTSLGPTTALAETADPAAAGVSPAASSSQAVVMRAFSVGGQAAVLYSLRVQHHAVPRRAHQRLALATARRAGEASVVHSRLAVSDPLPEPAPVFFFAP